MKNGFAVVAAAGSALSPGDFAVIAKRGPGAGIPEKGKSRGEWYFSDFSPSSGPRPLTCRPTDARVSASARAPAPLRVLERLPGG